MHRVAVLNADGRPVSYDDGVFTLEGSGQVSPRQLLGWGDTSVLSWEQAGMREWVARRATLTPPRRGRGPSQRLAVGLIAGIAAVLLLGGSLLGRQVFESAKSGQSAHFTRLTNVEEDRRDRADEAFRTLSRQYPEIDADAIAEKAEEAQ